METIICEHFLQICSLVGPERLEVKVAAEAKPERKQQNVARKYVSCSSLHTHPDSNVMCQKQIYSGASELYGD